jgi:hypothetical protein
MLVGVVVTKDREIAVAQLSISPLQGSVIFCDRSQGRAPGYYISRLQREARLLLSAFCFLLSTYCSLLTAYCLLPTAY